MGERLNGIQEVMGSTPTVSIRKQTGILPVCFFLCVRRGFRALRRVLRLDYCVDRELSALQSQKMTFYRPQMSCLL